MTEPDDAERFVDETGVDCLAVAAGNVHGHYSGPGPRLAEARGDPGPRPRSPLPARRLGAPEEDLRRAVSWG